MKTWKYFCGLILLGTACTSAPKEFQISGKFNNTSDDYILICGENQTIATADTIKLNKDGSFTYTKLLDNPCIGYMVVSDKGFYPILMINGTQTSIEPEKESTYRANYKGDLEQEYTFLKKATEASRTKTATEDLSFKDYQKLRTSFADSIGTAISKMPNKDFQKIYLTQVNATNSDELLHFADILKERGCATDSDRDYNNYMESLEMNKTNANYYMEWKKSYLYSKGKTNYLNLFTLLKQKIKDPEVRENVGMNLITSYFQECDETLEAVYNEAIPLINNKEARNYVEKTYKANIKTIPGSPAIDCKLEDTDGNQSKLSDFYGKVLYIDIWATWCGPCCEEIPYLHELVKHYQNDKRIEFISITVDANRKAWISKLKKDNPNWKQFRNTDFTQIYGITGIPCFIMIDKNGKIINRNAPRPSDKNIDTYIKKYLK